MGDQDLLELGFRRWNDESGGIQYECWYRIRSDGKVDLLARGHRVVVPVEAIPLLPESVARVILAAMLERPAAVDNLDAEDRLHMPALAGMPDLREKLMN